MNLSRQQLQKVPLSQFLELSLHIKDSELPPLPLELWYHILLQIRDLKDASILLDAHSQLNDMIRHKPQQFVRNYILPCFSNPGFFFCNKCIFDVLFHNDIIFWIRFRFATGAGYIVKVKRNGTDVTSLEINSRRQNVLIPPHVDFDCDLSEVDLPLLCYIRTFVLGFIPILFSEGKYFNVPAITEYFFNHFPFSDFLDFDRLYLWDL